MAEYPVPAAQEMPIHEESRCRQTDAAETDAQWYPNLFEVGWPAAPHLVLRNSTAEAWEAARPTAGVVGVAGLTVRVLGGVEVAAEYA